MAYLRDEDIENELEQMFGLPEDPDNSEDEYEGEDGIETNFDIRAMLEDQDIVQSQGSPTPGPSRRSPEDVGLLSTNAGEVENIDPDIGVPDIANSEDEEILRPVRPSRVSNLRSRHILESSPESSADSSSEDEDDNDWKKDSECRKKWKLIRDSYNRYKRKQKSSTGSAAPAKNSKWQFYERLRFLENTPSERQSSTSVDQEQQSSTSVVQEVTNTSSEVGHEDTPSVAADASVHNTISRDTCASHATSECYTTTIPPAPFFNSEVVGYRFGTDDENRSAAG
ncbi:hypothetical protein PYW07_006293 [Mythimna separata]|uniref:MADF domain-containing protein n=1 Tax=Mythimna separata TaxID=271217 RepID=A0AAD8DWE9_MYTSE|nr:hypothetical protein PYW07_006293 [Mythimna separata]